MRIAKFPVLSLLFIALSGCVSTPHAPTAEGAPVAKVNQENSSTPSEQLNLNETKTSMNVEGGFMRELSQEFSGNLSFQMRIVAENATTKWSPVVGVCLKGKSSEASACVQLLKISDMGPGYWTTFYYLSNKQSPRQHSQILVDHKAALGQSVYVTVRQKSEKLIFTIDGKDEVFPVPFLASSLEYFCSSAACEFRD